MCMSTPFTELSRVVNSLAMATGNDDLQSAMFMPEQHVYYPFGEVFIKKIEKN